MMPDRMTNEPFGQRVRVALAAARVGRAELARACKVSPQAVQRWCDGTAFPSSGNLMILAEMTGASAEWLMFPAPVDVRTTDWAINGTHIKNLVRTAMDEIMRDAP